MIDLLRDRRETIADVCRTLHVRRLEVFGSAATDMFDAGRSDVDFIVEFGEDSTQPGLLLRYLALAERLEQVVGCRVDLLTNRSIRNPYFRETVDRSREMIYDDGKGKVSA
jgi:predicted nucleotidyltransferase